ncbi:hypothetical protein SLA2020_406270 [Shorea laevis]
MKKADMKKIESSIYQEAYELEILRGAKVGIKVFSGEKPLISSSNPSKLLNLLQAPLKTKTKYHPHKDPELANIIIELNRKHDELLRQLEDEEKKEKRLEEMNAGGTGWWTKPLKELSLEELKQIEGVADNISPAPEDMSQFSAPAPRVRDFENAAETSTSSTVTNGNGN